MKEVWRPIPEWEGLYEVSSRGRVRSLSRIVKRTDGSTYAIKGQILKPGVSTGGGYSSGTHLLVCLQDAGGGRHNRCFRVHRLVAMAFKVKGNGPLIRHMDGNPFHNTPDNLRWGTAKENYDDMVRHGTKPPKALAA